MEKIKHLVNGVKYGFKVGLEILEANNIPTWLCWVLMILQIPLNLILMPILIINKVIEARSLKSGFSMFSENVVDTMSTITGDDTYEVVSHMVEGK